MSYDLFLRPRNGGFHQDRFFEYFRSRDHYEVDQQTWYKNENTGVYFVLELRPDPAATGENHFPVALNVNFFRPSYFILEVEPEVTAFVRHFDMLVSDPQDRGMGDGEYQEALLVSGWNHGNEFAYSALLRDPNGRNDVVSLPSSRLRYIWKWNLERRTLQAQVGESKFVPRIVFIRVDQRVSSAVVWPDGIPTVFPLVDHLIVVRQQLAPRRLFKRLPDRALIPMESARALLERHSTRVGAGAIVLGYNQAPKDIAQFVKALPAESRQIAGISADQVLDGELVEKYSA